MAVVATYAVLACSSLPPRSVEELAADTAIAAKVEAALVVDPDIYARHIDVAVNRVSCASENSFTSKHIWLSARRCPSYESLLVVLLRFRHAALAFAQVSCACGSNVPNPLARGINKDAN
jgi:hypothetical protein